MSRFRTGRSSGRAKLGSGGLGSTVVLAIGTFAVGADAFVVAGFLPSVAGALHVSTADGRQSITVFVVAYAILVPLIAATTARVPRRVMLVTALLVLGLANVVSALAPSLPVLITSRVLAAGGAAAYTPIAAALCTTLVSPRSRVPVLLTIVGGMAAATTLGLSLGELTGRWLGWRAAFGAVAALCLLAGVGVLLTVPRPPLRTVAARRAGLTVVLPITVLGILAGYGAYAWFVPARSTIEIPSAAAVLTLFVCGLGAMFVNAATGLRRTGEERRRIARELHDSLTHNIALIKVQAGIAVHLARQRGEPVPDMLLAIQEASGDAMRELRATLGTLRDTGAEPVITGLDRLPDLVGRARSAGLPAAVTVNGERRTLPADVDRTAYRIVQEALTNVARHAGDASALVQISFYPDSLGVRIDDDGRATPDAPPEPGVGLTGMHERVASLGGRLRTGPRVEGGFTVEAELPLRATEAILPHRRAHDHRMAVG